jgi:hypothetical protein
MAIIDDLISSVCKPLKVLTSSRSDEDIKYRFNEGPNVQIQATDNQRDIELFFEDKIANSIPIWRKRVSEELRTDIKTTIVNKSAGM